MSVSADTMPTHDIVHSSGNTLSSYPKQQQVPSQSEPHLIVRSGSLTQTPTTVEPENLPAESTQLNFPLVPSVQLEVVTAVAIVAIQIQLLASYSNKTTRAILSIGTILELLGISLAICFVEMYNIDAGQRDHSQPLPTLAHLLLRVPTLLILAGIVGLGAALVVETVEVSLGAAVTMGSFLVFGVVLCLSTSIFVI